MLQDLAHRRRETAAARGDFGDAGATLTVAANGTAPIRCDGGDASLTEMARSSASTLSE